eukprot:gene3209-biopygen2896
MCNSGDDVCDVGPMQWHLVWGKGFRRHRTVAMGHEVEHLSGNTLDEAWV